MCSSSVQNVHSRKRNTLETEDTPPTPPPSPPLSPTPPQQPSSPPQQPQSPPQQLAPPYDDHIVQNLPNEDLYDSLSPLKAAIAPSNRRMSVDTLNAEIIVTDPTPFLLGSPESHFNSWISKYQRQEEEEEEDSIYYNVFDPSPPPAPPCSSPTAFDYDSYKARMNLADFYSPTNDDFMHAPDNSFFHHEEAGETSYQRATSPSARMVGARVNNLGNTCFMNAILQCFTHTVPFVQGLRSCTHITTCGDYDGSFCAICALRGHIDASLEGSGGVVSPTRLVDNLGYFSSAFVRHQQGDAHEFMLCALDKLQKCFPDGEDNLVDKVFGGRLVSKLRCSNCGHSSDTYEPQIDLSLEIEDVVTIQRALESFTMVEKIDEKVTCDSCGEDVFMEKQFMLNQAPQIAALHLKRFKKDENSIRKIDNHVYFTMELDLQPYTSGNPNDNVILKYDLYAVVVHAGSDPNSGHYYCFIRSAPDKWHRLDDSEVTSVLGDEVLCQQAYILFYAQQGTPWFYSSIMESENPNPNSVSEDVAMDEQKPKPSGVNRDDDDDPMDAHNENIDDSGGESGDGNISQGPP